MTRIHVLRPVRTPCDADGSRMQRHAIRARNASGEAIRKRRAPIGSIRAFGARLLQDETGSATAEYAVVILAAVAFAGVLVGVMRSHEVEQILTNLVRDALTS